MSSTAAPESAAAATTETGNESSAPQRTRTNRRTTHNQVSNPINYEGECSEVGAILGLKVEKFNKKASYEVFIEKVSNYIVKKYTDGADIKTLLIEGKDPVEEYEINNMPKDPTAEQLKFDIKS